MSRITNVYYGMGYHVGKAEFERLVETALADMPEHFRTFLDEVPIEVRGRATFKQRQRLGLRDNELLLGLYQGTSLAHRSVMDGLRLPAVIYLFQEDIESASHSAIGLVNQVRKTVLHEIGHHFGLDEADLNRLGYG